MIYINAVAKPKLSDLNIDTDKDWGGYAIKSASIGELVASASLPTCDADHEGQVYRVRDGAASKTYKFTCSKNSSDTYEWDQEVIST